MDTPSLPLRRSPLRFVASCAVFVVGLAPFAFGALLGPTLVLLAPFLLFSGACLISGTAQRFDERERAALRARRTRALEATSGSVGEARPVAIT